MARPSFPGAVRSELLKIRTQALTWLLVAVFAILCAVVIVLLVTGDSGRKLLLQNPTSFYFRYLEAVLGLYTFGSGVFLLILTSRLVSMEYGTGTVRIVLARGTGRLSLLAAQLTAMAISGLMLLAGFLVMSATALYLIVVAWKGSFSPITSLPAAAWTDTWLNVMVALVSMAVCILLGTAAAVIGRSVAFGLGAALSFFPADNFGTIVMLLLSRLTHQDFWRQVTQYLLGPVLNQLPVALQTDHRSSATFASPLVPVDATHCWVVIGAYSFVFLIVAIVLTWRRDVVH